MILTRILDEPSGKCLLRKYAIASPRGVVVRTAEEALMRVSESGLEFPLAIKIVSPDAVHKSDIGGVILGLRDPAALQPAVESLIAGARDKGLALVGVLIEEMASAGHELMIGGIMDERFGPCLMLGTGGIYVEVMSDACFSVCPIDEQDAREMVEQLRSLPMLRGARGKPPLSEPALISALLAIGGEDGLMMNMRDELVELDINPLIVSRDGATACDARIVLKMQ
ncbi:MAG: acetate--CoA ligase family protein [Acidobacteriota bacterium]